MNDIILFKSMNNNWEIIELNRAESTSKTSPIYMQGQ
jgi:hypothetical protein